LDPRVVREAAEIQMPPVEVVDSQVVPVESPAAPAEPPATTVPPKVEIVRTDSADEALLRRAIAGHSSLQPALNSEGSSIITLPGLVQITEAGGNALQLKPFILVSQPLQREPNGQFAGELLIGVSEVAATNEARDLPTPLMFQIAGTTKSDPERVVLDTTSPPFRRVKVWLNAAQGAAARLLVLSLLDKGGTPIEVPVAPALDVDTASASIEGWGLETTKVEVSISNQSNAANRRVTLHVAPSGYLDRSVLKLDQDGAAEAELRSDGVGTAVIRATSSGFAPASARVTYRLPVRTLGASMAGGLLGSLVSFMVGPRRRKPRWVPVVGAALFGVLVFALYVVGINLLPLQPKVTVGAAFVFAVSALAGWLGPRISAWTRKLSTP
jgi:hypothetical protein